MNIPQKYSLCKTCKNKPIPRWLKDKIEEWKDMAYPYETLRPTLEKMAKKDLCQKCAERLIKEFDAANRQEKLVRSSDAQTVPLNELCELLAQMYHCPSTGFPSSGRACNPLCSDKLMNELCGIHCEGVTDAERWKMFLIEWMEGLDGSASAGKPMAKCEWRSAGANDPVMEDILAGRGLKPIGNPLTSVKIAEPGFRKKSRE